MNDLILCATPYDTSANWFYFKTFEEYQEKQKKHFNGYGDPVEEYEVQFIDGTEDQCEFAKMVEPDQCNLEQWFEDCETYCGLDELQQVAIAYLLTHLNYSFEEAMSKLDDVQVYEGKKEDYAYELVEDCYDLPEFAKTYFDYDAFARDLDMNGDICEWGDYVITNACQL